MATVDSSTAAPMAAPEQQSQSMAGGFKINNNLKNQNAVNVQNDASSGGGGGGGGGGGPPPPPPPQRAPLPPNYPGYYQFPGMQPFYIANSPYMPPALGPPQMPYSPYGPYGPYSSPYLAQSLAQTAAPVTSAPVTSAPVVDMSQQYQQQPVYSTLPQVNSSVSATVSTKIWWGAGSSCCCILIIALLVWWWWRKSKKTTNVGGGGGSGAGFNR